MIPTVVHIRRAPAGDDLVRIDRRTPWGNPFKIGDRVTVRGKLVVIDRPLAVALFDTWARTSDDPQAVWIRTHAHELWGKRLGCWCYPEACHGGPLAALTARTCQICLTVYPDASAVDPESGVCLHCQPCPGCGSYDGLDGRSCCVTCGELDQS